MQKEKMNSVYLLKCIAALLITNSHFNRLYPDSISFLAFGGYFGNTLFFLMSGFLLAGCDKNCFSPWYGRRVLRIYIPYLVIIPLLLFENYTKTLELEGIIEWLFPIKKFHFIPTIIVLYPFYYVATYLNNRKMVSYWASLFFVVTIQLLYYFFMFDFSYEIDGDFKFIPMMSYFEIMLIGGIIRQYKETVSQYKVVSVVFMLVSFILYVYQVFRPFTGYLGIAQLFAGLVFSSSLAGFIISFEGKMPKLKIINVVGNLTLEVYLVQFLLIDAFLYYAFPLNIFLCLISIIATAYCTNYISEKIKKMIPIMR